MKSVMSFRKLRSIAGATSLFILALAAVGCGERNTYVQPPPPEVEVVNPIVGTVAVPVQAPGRTRAFARAEIRARVPGFLGEPEFQPGNFVKKDQVLYHIEPDEFQAAVQAAQGQRDAAEAGLGIAQTNFEKRENASKSGSVSKIDVATAKAERDAAKASVDIAQAALEDAKRALDYTEVKSPIVGRVSQTLVDVGNLVGADGPTLLTTVIQDDPIYVDFEANERAILQFLPTRPGADREGYDEKFKAFVVRLTLSDGSDFPITGNLDFLDNQVNPETGTIKVRAVFKNPDGAMAAGMFVRIEMDEDVENAIQVPAIAIQRDLGGVYVVIVGADNVAERRPIEESRHSLGENVVLTSGLKAEDRVIVTNLQKARPGVPVVVVEATPKTGEPSDTPDSNGASATEEKPAAATAEETPAKADTEAKP
jgi:multidrug efflux system membrane fusion protein